MDASATASNSYMDKAGKIHLQVTMQYTQPQKLSVTVKEVVLDDNKIYPASSETPIELKMEDWTLQVKNWKLSPEEGGITSSNGLIRTSQLDIPFSVFTLRKDMFVMDGFKLDQLKIGGGIKSLDNIDASNAALVFDNKTGTDYKPHWRFSMSSTGTPVAMLANLPGLSDAVGINYIQLLSNGENIIQLQQTDVPLHVNGNSSARFRPQLITNGPNYFDISGTLNIGAPRTGDMVMDLHYDKPGATLQMAVGNIVTEFEGKGFVHFTAKQATAVKSNIAITQNQIAIDGEIEEKSKKSFNTLPATLYVNNNTTPKYTVALPKDLVMQLTQSGNGASQKGFKLTIDKGSMDVVGADWDILTYSGTMESNTAVAGEKGIEPMYLTFKVLGDVSVDGSGAKMEGIETPFGQMNMVFDFAAKRLVGTLVLNNVQLGTNMISGTVETLFDPEGFYVAGGGTADVKTGNAIVDGTYNLGFMIGSYPLKSPGDNLWKVVTAYKQADVRNDCYVSKLNGRLKGFYFTVDRILFDESEEFDFVLISGYVQAKAIVGADFWANFSGQTALGIAVQVYAHAAAGMSACTGTSLSGEATARAGLVMKYENSKFSLDGKIDISFIASISQYAVLTTLYATKSVGASAVAGTSGFGFELNSGDKKSPCY
jgi:hypothetical protein